jgi:hypothetical protein
MVKKERYKMKSSQFFCIPIVEKKWTIDTYVYYFPEVLAELLVEKKEKSNEKRKKYLHLNELNAWILTLFPSVFFVKSLFPTALYKPWILSDEPLPIYQLESLVRLWVENHPGAPSFLPSFSICEKQIQILCSNGTHPNGTANPKCGEDLGLNAFDVWPRYFAKRLNGMPYEWEDGGRYVKGKLFTSLPASQKGKVRLLSWPPHGKKNNWAYQVKISLQTIPEDEYPYLYIHPQTLRMAENTYLRSKDSQISLILGNKKGNKMCFSEWSGVPISQMKNRDFSEKIGELFQWEQKIPSYQAFREQPLKYIQEAGFSVFALHSSNMIREHSVKSGLSPIERYQLANQVKENLVNNWDFFSKSWPNKEKIELKQQRKKLSIKNFSLPGTFLLIRLNKEDKFWQEEMVRTLQKELKLEVREGKFVHQKSNNEFEEVQIKTVSAEEIFGPNPYDIEIHTKEEMHKEQARRQFAEKISERIANRFPEIEDGRTFAFIELPNKENFQPGQDPKHILRQEFAKKGILNQFITPPELSLTLGDNKENNEYKAFSSRCKNGVLDMLRQMGVIKWKIDEILPVPTACIGIHLMKNQNKTRIIPLLTAVFGHQVYTYLNKEVGWLPYPKAVINFVRQGTDYWKIERDSIATFIYQAIKQLKRKFSPEHIILYGVAENLRTYIPWLQNSVITNDRVRLGKDIFLDQDVSFVRLRGEGEEALEWVAYGQEIGKENSLDAPLPACLQTHLVEWSDRLFLSVAKRPDTARSMGNHLYHTKLDRENVYYRKETAVEIYIPVCNEKIISPKDLAVFTHNFRQRASVQYKDYLFAPLPLHLSILLEEYLKSES